MICAWPTIWTLSGRLSLMRTVQLMNNMSDASKNIFRVYHIRIIAPQKKNGSHDMKHTDSSIIIVMNVCVLTSASMIVYLFVTRSWSAIVGTKQPKVNQSPQQWRGRQTCTRICRFLIVRNIFRLETCMNSLVKVPPYSKLNFQGKHFFTQNWCNITLNGWWLILLQDWSGLYAWLLMNDRSMNDDWLLNERNGMNNTSTNLQKTAL
jgi:hypothetical protein